MVEKRYAKTDLAQSLRQHLDRAFRARQGTTNRELADYCEVTEQAVSKWRKTGEIKLHNILQIADFFRIPPLSLMGDLMGAGETPEGYDSGRINAQARRMLDAWNSLTPELRDEYERHLSRLSQLTRRKS